MSKTGHLKRRVNREIERQLRKTADKTTQEKRPLLTKFGSFVLWMVTIPSVAVGVLQLLPRVSISPESPITPSNALSVPFLLSNDGYVPIYNVNVLCAPRGMIYVDPSDPTLRTIIAGGPDDAEETGGIQNPDLEVAKLPPAVKTTFPCALGFLGAGRGDPATLTSGHMVLVSQVYSSFTTIH